MLRLTGSSLSGSTLCVLQAKKTEHFEYSPFGSCENSSATSSGLPGFNGQRRDPLTAVSHLGNGYRAYSPTLMRFTCPDNMSPFGKGGVNPYVYCDSDPINKTDPSGHFILFLMTLFSTLATAAAETVGIAAAGAEAGAAAAAGAEAAGAAAASGAEAAGAAAASGAVATSVEAGAATASEVTSATAVASTSAGTSAVGAIDTAASAIATPTAAATLGTVNAAIGTAIQVSKMTTKTMVAALFGSGMGAASFYTRLGKSIAAANSVSLAESSLPEGTVLQQSMPSSNTYPFVTTIEITTQGNALTVSNRASSSAQKVGVGSSPGVQGTPSKKKYLQSMGYHPSRFQTNTVFQGLNQDASSNTAAGKKSLPASKSAWLSDSEISGINNRDLHQQSYKTAELTNSPVK